tara:strand:+ start:31 stop:213 length:183 start_codon:yes stop_codon:yes gene_type:complete
MNKTKLKNEFILSTMRRFRCQGKINTHEYKQYLKKYNYPINPVYYSKDVWKYLGIDEVKC